MIYEKPKAHKMDLKTQNISDNRSCNNNVRFFKCQMLVNTIKKRKLHLDLINLHTSDSKFD